MRRAVTSLLKVVVDSGLRFEAGLLRNRTLGLSVSVCVRFVCPCTLFESVDGHPRVVEEGRLVRWTPSTVRLLIMLLGSWQHLTSGICMPLSMASESNSVLLRNSRLKWCLTGWCVVLLTRAALTLNTWTALFRGRCRLMTACSSMSPLVLELLTMFSILLWQMLRLSLLRIIRWLKCEIMLCILIMCLCLLVGVSIV